RVLSAGPDDIGEWWLVLSRWARVGAAAAVVVAILAGALLLQFEGRDSRVAYEQVLSQPAAYSLDMTTHAPSDDPDAPLANPILRYGLPGARHRRPALTNRIHDASQVGSPRSSAGRTARGRTARLHRRPPRAGGQDR